MHYRLIPVLLYLFLVSSVLAQTSPDSLKTWTLPTVRVIINSPSDAIGQLTRVVSPTPAAANLKDALQNLPGISATQGSKDESNLRLRGFRKNEVKIMVDGRPLNNGYFGNVDLSKLAALDIREIQIIKGPVTPQYGTNCMGGVVNIITNSPRSDKWLSLESVIKRNNNQDYRLTLAHGFDGFSYNLSGAWQKTSGFMLSKDFTPTNFEGGGVRDNSGGTKLNLNGGVRCDLFDFHELSFDFNLSSMDDKNLPSSIYERKRRNYDYWLRESSGFSGKFQLNETMLLTALLAQDRAKDRLLEYNYAGGTEILSLDSSMQTDSYSFAPKLKIQLASNQSLDLGYRGELLLTTRKDNDYYLNWTDNRVQVHSAYAQYAQPLGSDWLLNSALGTVLSTNSETGKLQFMPEPALGIEYSGWKGTQSKLALGFSSTQPTLRQMFSASKGNPALKPQSAFKAELSHQNPLWGKTLSASGSVYYNRTRDLIDLYLGHYENIFRVDSYGAEAELVFTPHSLYQATLDYAWLDYLKTSDYRLTETPPHALDISQTVKLPWHLTLNMNSAYRHSRLSQDDSGNYHTLKAYWKHDASLHLPYKTMSLELGCENILDEDYQGEYGFPEPGRDYYFSVKVAL